MIDRLFSKWLAADELSRALQLSGFIRFGCMLLQGIILVKAGLSPLIIAVVESFYFIFNLSRSALLSGGKYAGFSALRDGQLKFSDYFLSFNLLGLVATIIVSLIMWFGGDTFASFLDHDQFIWLLPLVVFLSLPADTFDIHYVQQKRYAHIYWYTAIVSLIQLVGLVWLLLNGYDMGQVLLLFLGIYVVRYIHLALQTQGLARSSLRIAWVFFIGAVPLVFHSLLAGLSSYVDGWLIKECFDDTTFAIYRYGARELPINSILIGSVVSGLLLIKSSIDEKMKVEMTRILRLLVPVLSVLMLVSPLLFQWVYNEEYKLSALFFNMYAILLMSRVLFVQVYFYRAGHRWSLTLLSGIEVVLNVILSLLLLGPMGLLGIPTATVIADVMMRAVMVLWSNQRYGKTTRAYVPWKTYFISLCAILVSFLLSTYLFFADFI